MSLAARLRKLEPRKKALARSNIEKFLFELEYGFTGMIAQNNTAFSKIFLQIHTVAHLKLRDPEVVSLVNHLQVQQHTNSYRQTMLQKYIIQNTHMSILFEFQFQSVAKSKCQLAEKG